MTPSWSGVPPLLSVSCIPCAKVRMLQFGGVPPSLPPWMHARITGFLFGVPPSLPSPRMSCMRIWVGGSPSSSVPWTHARRVCCRGWRSPLGGASLLPIGWDPPPPPPLPLLHAVHGKHTLLQGCPLFDLLVRGFPPFISCMPCTGSAHCLGGAPSSPSWSGDPLPSLSCMPSAGSAQCLGGAPPLPSWSGDSLSSLVCMPCIGTARCLGGAPPFALLVQPPTLSSPSPACRLQGAHAAVWGGSPPSSSPWLHPTVACYLFGVNPSLSSLCVGCTRC